MVAPLLRFLSRRYRGWSHHRDSYAQRARIFEKHASAAGGKRVPQRLGHAYPAWFSRLLHRARGTRRTNPGNADRGLAGRSNGLRARRLCASTVAVRAARAALLVYFAAQSVFTRLRERQVVGHASNQKRARARAHRNRVIAPAVTRGLA